MKLGLDVLSVRRCAGVHARLTENEVNFTHGIAAMDILPRRTSYRRTGTRRRSYVI